MAAQAFQYRFDPQTREVVLNTDATLITPVGAPPFVVVGGIFQFRSVRIGPGVTVRGEGSRPMIWLVLEDFVVDGELTVRGQDGEMVDTLNSANFPVLGGRGVCGGGDGGNGSPNTTSQSFLGQSGFGPSGVANFGGGGGRISAFLGSICTRGSGGGGGSFATQGDPWFPTKAIGTSFLQQLGEGGRGCAGVSGAATRQLLGGAPGPRVFFDGRDENDFFGLGVDLNRRVFVQGELPYPIGGSGGGGGGDQSTQLGSPNWINDAKGGGGGGGGGAVVVVALGRIVVNGKIVADGGHGGGGEQAGGNHLGGGGGGGSGGMVVLYSKTQIELTARGETYANRDYDFVLSADGGIGRQGRWGGTEFLAKYPPLTTPQSYDANPAGAFGGMGVVQLMAPVGDNRDGTNTHLDDNIVVRRTPTGAPLTGAEKRRFLAWRGFPNAQGIRVDDFGQPTNIGDNEGDIRPTPVLLPVF